MLADSEVVIQYAEAKTNEEWEKSRTRGKPLGVIMTTIPRMVKNMVNFLIGMQ